MRKATSCKDCGVERCDDNWLKSERSARCKKCLSEYRKIKVDKVKRYLRKKKWVENNKDKHRDHARKYANSEHGKKARMEYRIINSDKQRLYNKRYDKKRSEKRRQQGLRDRESLTDRYIYHNLLKIKSDTAVNYPELISAYRNLVLINRHIKQIK